ncbi:PhaM family polyhydroxyalkanoate granule multifunctional regulatory protein [Trinickia sp.]|uniref:PhaM family polyhydroxyalkanoate granule multifunctional regulatory protein n=1 Tax=Trinickia sp. TaxID=2571163 RepID=UPI003F80AD32
MTDTAGDKPPFPGFPGFPPAEMLDKMWDMMRLTPFGAAFPGMQPGTAQGFSSPLSAMSDMMSPLMNVEELDKRITDMRAVEQWLKLNLSMLQSAIQALEVQRATLSTLSAFGAFAKASMTQPAESARAGAQSSPASSWSQSTSAWPGRSSDANAGQPAGAGESGGAEPVDEASGAGAQAGETGGAAFDPSGWWNLLQSQFNQLAAFAMTQPGGAEEAGSAPASSKKAGSDGAPRAKAAAEKRAPSSEPPSKPAAKRPSARKSTAKPASSAAARGEK